MNRRLYILLIIFAPVLTSAQVQIDTTVFQEEISQTVITHYRTISPVSGIADGSVSINMEKADLLPRFAGSADPVKYARLMSGVQTTGDGESGLFIRGGDIGYGNISLNGAPLYSYNHLLGFFSNFNPNHIKTVNIDKSGYGSAAGESPGPCFSAKTSDRVNRDFGLKGDIGLISSQATLSVPIGKSVSMDLSARISYSGWLTSMISPENTDLDYRFQDYDASVVWDVSKRSKLILNGHYNHDKMLGDAGAFLAGGNIEWHSVASSAQLMSELSDKWFMDNILYYSHYDNNLNLSTFGASLTAFSSISDIGLKNSVSRLLDWGEMAFGFNASFKNIHPQSFLAEHYASDMGSDGIREIYNSLELIPYASLTANLSADMWLRASVRYPFYSVFHDGKRFSTSMPEPGLSAQYALDGRQRIRANYSYGAHYTHLISLSNISFSTDFWMPATEDVPSMKSHNASIGYYGSYLGGRLNLSTEIYYRFFGNVVEYDFPVMSLIHEAVDTEDHIHSGIGEAYGWEVMASYSTKKWNCMLSYTLGRSVRQFDELNEGKPFYAKQDRRHDLSVAINYRPAESWDFGAVFVYATGSAYTAPTDFYMTGGTIVRGHGSYNASRMRDYNRLDLSMTYWFNREHKHGLNLSVYNCYSRTNPIYVSWQIRYDEEKEDVVTFKKNHTIYRILPSLSWIFKF